MKSFAFTKFMVGDTVIILCHVPKCTHTQLSLQSENHDSDKKGQQ